MPDLLLDQNVPYPVLAWLRSRLPDAATEHCTDLGLGRSTDLEVFQSAQAAGAIIVTYDEDFADQRLFPVGTHKGVVRLRVEPTTDEVTIEALDRLFTAYAVQDLVGKLVIVDSRRIRILGG